MAVKYKTKRVKTLKSKKIKYSLNDRVKHYSNICKTESKKNSKYGVFSKKEDFASGYIQGAERGLSLNYNKLSKYAKLGQKAGYNAQMKSKSIKF